MLDIRCQERFDTVTKFAKDNNCHDAFQETLNYLATYYNKRDEENPTNCVPDITVCMLFSDFAPNSFTFEMCKFVDGERISRFCGGMIYWDDDKKWTVHT
jgi:inosine-uridine nucleoside N-ribohydrolase